MIQSMTGFASKSIIIDSEIGKKIKISLNIKSLNSKYFDINCKLPQVLNQFETEIIKLIKSYLIRGYIYLNIHLEGSDSFQVTIKPEMIIISEYINALNRIQNQFKLNNEIKISDILLLPNIFIFEEKGLDSKSKDIIFNTVLDMVHDLINERKKEGATLELDFHKRINSMQKEIQNIESLFEKSLTEQKEKISKRLKEINEGNETFADSQRQALYMLLDKIDINEEIVRFKSHLNNMQIFLKSDVFEKGKQLDFILQELSREINTIAAKTTNAQISESSITIKVEIEKLREQAQNIV